MFNATGKHWEEWRTILDGFEAYDKDHIVINIILCSDFKLSDWWAAAVATGYEQMIGRRQKYQGQDGYFRGAAAKTIHGSYDLVWSVIGQTKHWLDPATLVERSNSWSGWRFDEIDRGEVIQFWLTDKGDRVMVRAIGEKFLTAEDALAWKAVWRKRLEHLAHVIEDNEWYVIYR